MEGVIGFDRTFGLNRYLNLQYFATFIPQAAETTSRRYADGITYEVSDKFFQDDLELAISGIIGFAGQGWTMQPYAEYQSGDNWLLVASILFFEGDEDGTYGQFDENDFLTLRVQFSF